MKIQRYRITLALSVCRLLLFKSSDISVRSESNLPSFHKSLKFHAICNEEVARAFDKHGSDNNSKQSKQHRTNILQSAVCFHSHNYIVEAMQLYNYLRQLFPNFAFPLVNIALTHLKNGQPEKVIEHLNVYFEEVGGMYGNGTGPAMRDYDTLIVGTPCLPHALHRIECVNALNFYGIAHVELYNYAKAHECYKRAIEIGHDVNLINDVYQNLGGLFNTIGLFNDAADSFLKSFWTSIQTNANVNPVALLQRAMLVPVISSSLEESISFKTRFEKRMHDLIRLIEFGGVGWGEEDGDLFRVQSGISNIDDIRALLVSFFALL